MLYLALFVSIGVASPTYPSVVADYLSMPCQPTCSLCHDGTPGGGTATTDFALAAKDRGLTASNTSALQDALDQLDADGVDSDGDGTTDIDALVAGTDPNPGGDDFCSTTSPTYGCLSYVSRRPAGALGLASLTLFAVAMRRRRFTQP